MKSEKLVNDMQVTDLPPQKPSYAFYTAPGMPPLEFQRDTKSFFEFWPTWLMYLPVVIQWLWLSIRYRSLTLPFIANPRLPVSGMVGVEKSALLSQAQSPCTEAVLDWFVYTSTLEPPKIQAEKLLAQIESRGMALPVVCKPNIGCRGAGVKLVKSLDELHTCLKHYPEGAEVFVQRLSDWEPEAGVFYVRSPAQPEGKIISLALKYSPYLVGDGHSTIAELMAQDPRAKDLQHLYYERHCDQLGRVLARGETFKLVFSASHCRGAIFKNANQHVTEALTQSIDEYMQALPDFHYGRLDIKFKDLESLKRGESIQIIEINGASSESLHIWDSDTRLKDAIKALLFQYQQLFWLGDYQRSRGHKPPSLKTFFAHWRKESSLTKHYPSTD